MVSTVVPAGTMCELLAKALMVAMAIQLANPLFDMDST